VITINLSQFWIQRLGWTLLHFLWQGTAIVIVYALLRHWLARLLSANGRYLLACAALAAMTIAPPVTFLLTPDVHPSMVASWTLSVSESQRLLTGVVTAWLLGVLAFSIRLFGGWRFISRLRSASHPAPAEWQQTLQHISERVSGVPLAARWPRSIPCVRLLVSSMVDVPTVIGWLRPVILVPVEFLTGLPSEHIEALLAHELAHIRRRDYLASVLQSVAEAVLFYHPAVWWISEQIRAERELCCDDLAVAASGDVLTYARALAALELRQPSRLKPALAANGGLLVNRIRRLIEPSHATANHLPGPAAAWTMTLLWLVGVGVVAVHAAQTPVQPAPVVKLNANLSGANSDAANLTRVPTPAQSATTPVPSGSLTALARNVRNSLLYDPLLPAQLASPQSRGDAPGGTVADKAQSLWRDWLNNDVAYIITAEERSAFVRLSTDEERAKFVEQFWMRRDPTPDTVENEFKQEHYRRIAYANEHFGSTVPGWKTDRGRIYITLGQPDEIEFHPSGGAVWRYRNVEGMDNLIAIEFAGSEYRMTTDQAVRGRSSNLHMRSAPLAATPGPAVSFENLEAAIDSKTTSNLPPMQVRIDYLRASGSSAIANITVQFENRDLHFRASDGTEKAMVKVLGRVSSMNGVPVTTFQRSLEIDATADGLREYARRRTVVQGSVRVSPGPHRLNVVAEDTVAGNLNNYELMLDVPRFDDDKLASSSLILADTIEKLPTRSLAAGAMYPIGDTKVRPRIGNRFTSQEKVGIYLQVYNFKPDESSKKPVGSIEYEIDKAGSNERVLGVSEDIGTIPNASASQVTIAKLLPLKTFQPGTYTLRVTVTDRNGSQTLQRQGEFTVSPE
jgi:GWxTD domain-containing protein